MLVISSKSVPGVICCGVIVCGLNPAPSHGFTECPVHRSRCRTPVHSSGKDYTRKSPSHLPECALHARPDNAGEDGAKVTAIPKQLCPDRLRYTSLRYGDELSPERLSDELNMQRSLIGQIHIRFGTRHVHKSIKQEISRLLPMNREELKISPFHPFQV
jgi:hypothetical protein